MEVITEPGICIASLIPPHTVLEEHELQTLTEPANPY